MGRRIKTDPPSSRLFADDQRDLFEKSYEERLKAEKNKPVECLGMTFPNDDERRKYFLEKLREKLRDPEFHKIGGFPIGEDEDILTLSDPSKVSPGPAGGNDQQERQREIQKADQSLLSGEIHRRRRDEC